MNMTRLEALALALGVALFGIAAAVSAEEARVRPAPYGGFEVVTPDGRVTQRIKPRALGHGYDRFGADGRRIGSLEPRRDGVGYTMQDVGGRREGEIRPEAFGSGYAVRDRDGRVIGSLRPGPEPGEFIYRQR